MSLQIRGFSLWPQLSERVHKSPWKGINFQLIQVFLVRMGVTTFKFFLCQCWSWKLLTLWITSDSQVFHITPIYALIILYPGIPRNLLTSHSATNLLFFLTSKTSLPLCHCPAHQLSVTMDYLLTQIKSVYIDIQGCLQYLSITFLWLLSNKKAMVQVRNTVSLSS